MSACGPVTDVAQAVVSSPRLLYHLAFIQCLVWVGLTAWNLYSLQWFAISVYEGDEKGDEQLRTAYADGKEQFARGGEAKAGVQLVSSLVIIAILLVKRLPPQLVYSTCIFIGSAVSILAAFFVQHNGTFALVCMMLSVMPEVGSFAIPFGLVAVLSQAAAKEGKQVSTALQMALLNCCITVGQQITTVSLATAEFYMAIETALPLVFLLGAVSLGIGGVSALFLDDSAEEDDEGSDDEGSESCSE